VYDVLCRVLGIRVGGVGVRVGGFGVGVEVSECVCLGVGIRVPDECGRIRMFVLGRSSMFTKSWFLYV